MADTLLSVTKADLQPSGKTVTGLSAHALDPAAVSPTGSTFAVGLAWVISGLALSPAAQTVDLRATSANTLFVDAASPTISAKTTTSTWTEQANAVALSLSAQSVTLSYTSSGVTLSVTSATPTIAAQDVDFEEVHEFDSADITITAQTVAMDLPTILSVTSVSLTPSQPSVTLRTTLRTDYASPTIAGQDATFPIVLAVTRAAPSLSSPDVALTYGFSYTITADSTTVTAYGQNVSMTASVPVLSVTAATPTIAGQSVAFAGTWAADSASLTPASGSITTDYKAPTTYQAIAATPYTFPLNVGLVTSAASLTPSPKDITLRVSITGYLPVEHTVIDIDTQVVGMRRDGLSNQVSFIGYTVSTGEVGTAGLTGAVSTSESTGTIRCAA